MRRTTFFASVVATVALVGGVEQAETVIRCGETFACYGTSGPDLIKKCS